jgi:hypothetical protein
MTYTIIAYIDGLDYVVGNNVPEENLEEFLHRLTRKQEFKNVSRYDIRENTCSQ